MELAVETPTPRSNGGQPADAPAEPVRTGERLRLAMRQARVDDAERGRVVAELRGAEVARLEMLRDELVPVFAEVPKDADLFDLALVPSERPRLFIDMIAFVDMGRDRRTYRFFQDTLHGRVMIAESQQIDRIAAAVTNYVARRLVERERALASGCAGPETGATSERRSEDLAAPEAAAERGPAAAAAAPATPSVPPLRPPRQTWGKRLGNALSFVVTTLGSITLIGLLALGLFVAWTIRLRDLWAHWIGAPPF